MGHGDAKLDGLRGPVFRPDDAGYVAETASANLTAVHHPAVVVGADRVDDVVTAVRVAADDGLPLRVQATGHGTGIGADDGVLVTTRRLRELSIDPEARTVRIGAGLVWSEVIEAVAHYGLAAPCGSAPTVGVIGYLLGGGVSPLGRTYGFASDHVSSIEMVAADGAVHAIDRDTDPGLFWALRGGKIGVGIVTSVTMRLFPLGSLYGGGLFFDADQAAVALRTWSAWAPTLTDQTTSSVALLRLPDLPDIPPALRNRFAVHIRLAHVGDDVSGEAVAAPLRGIGPPLLDTIARMPYASIASIHADPTGPLPIWGAGSQLREFPDEAASALLAAAGPDMDVPLAAVELRHLGGAFARSPQPPDAVSGRDAGFIAFIVGAPVPELFTSVVPAAATGVLAALSPWTLRGPQANFSPDSNDAAALSSSWPAQTQHRLGQLKTRYDPNDVFRFGASRPDGSN